MSDWDHEPIMKVITGVKTESHFPIGFFTTGSLYATSAIAIWWPSNRLQV